MPTSNNQGGKTPQQVLKEHNAVIIASVQKLASLIKAHEKISWKDSLKKSRQLRESSKAYDYVKTVRATYSGESKEAPQPRVPKKSPPQPKKKVRRDRFSQNYRRLMALAPGLDERLLRGEQVTGKSRSFNFMDFNLDYVGQNERGYYIAISHYYEQNGDLVPDPDMILRVDISMEIVEALVYRDYRTEDEVYDNYMNPERFSPKMKKSQNSFLETWLKNLKKQGHKIVFDEVDIESEVVDDKDQSLSAIDQRNDQGYKFLGDFSGDVFYQMSVQSDMTVSQAQAMVTDSDKLVKFIKDEYAKLVIPKPKDAKRVAAEILKLNTTDTEGSQKPDISFMDDDFVNTMRDTIGKVILDELIQKYLAHCKGEKPLTPVTLFFVVERLNDSPLGIEVPYPQEPTIREDYQRESNSESLEVSSNKNAKPDISFIDKSLVEQMRKKVKDDNLGAVVLYLKHQRGEQEVNALSLYFIAEHINEGGMKIKVDYPSEQQIKEAYRKLDKTKQKQQVQKELETEVEKTKEFLGISDESDTSDKPDSKEVEETVKHWAKLAKVIGDVEGLSEEASKKKALKLKESGEAEDYVIRAFNRRKSSGLNGLFKLNYQKLVKLIPEIGKSSLDGLIGELVKESGQYVPFIYEFIGEMDKFNYSLSIQENGEFSRGIVILGVNKRSKKVWVISLSNNFMGEPDFKEEISDFSRKEKVNELLGVWLGTSFSLGYKSSVSTSKKGDLESQRKQYPIVLEFSEGSSEKNVGINSLDELQKNLRSHKYPKKGGRGYSKTYVWFKNYPSYVRIDLSGGTNNYDPRNMELLGWLNKYDFSHDWEQYQESQEIKEPKSSSKEKDIGGQQGYHSNFSFSINYKRLLNLIPGLQKADLNKLSGVLYNERNAHTHHRFKSNGKVGETSYSIRFDEVWEKKGFMILGIDRKQEHAWLIEWKDFGDKPNFDERNFDESIGKIANTLFRDWLKKTHALGIKGVVGKPKLNELGKQKEKYPIVLEWTEANGDENIGFNSLDEVQKTLKSFGFTKSPLDTYIKNKLWFKGYQDWVRIDLSKSKGDYNPNELDLIDWLKVYDPSHDWEQYQKSQKSQKSTKSKSYSQKKELTWEEKWRKAKKMEIPDFELGKVKLTAAHRLIGLTQKDINKINRTKRGITITPVGDVNNNTRSIQSDLQRNALAPGFRVSGTGKLYGETRSNRSDVTDQGI